MDKVEIELKVGYTVELISGGPDMTVAEISPEPVIHDNTYKLRIYCQWFDKWGIQGGWFSPNSLRVRSRV